MTEIMLHQFMFSTLSGVFNVLLFLLVYQTILKLKYCKNDKKVPQDVMKTMGKQ